MQQQKQLADFRGKIKELERLFDLLVSELKQAIGEKDCKKFEGKIDSLPKLKELYSTLEKQLSPRQEHENAIIVALLAKADRIAPADERESVSLKQLKEKIRSYREILSSDEKSYEAIALKQQFMSGNHPVNAILRLLVENLSFSETEKAFQAVSAEFGTSLALAAARGNLVINDMPTDKNASRDTVAVPKPAVSKELPENYADLLCLMIREEKLGPAFWLAAYFEQKRGAVPIPAWLIRTLETAAVIRLEEGAAAEWLSYLYSEYDFSVPAGSDMRKKLTYNLLFFAASLRPALAAPYLGARSILVNQNELPEKLKSLAAAAAGVEEGRGKKVSAAWEKEMKLLTNDVQSWVKQNRKLTLVSPLASQLWEMMFEEKGLLHKLLQPMLAGNGEKIADIHVLLNSLQGRDNLKNELRRLYQEVPGIPEDVEIFHIPGSWQLINRLKSVLKLAKRYVRLHDKAIESKQAGSPKFAAIQHLLGPAREELKKIISQHGDDPLLETALIAAGRALTSAENYMTEKENISAAPEKAASLEIKENPQLMFKPPWIPQEKTIERIGKALLELLSDNYLQEKDIGRGSTLYVREETVPFDIEYKVEQKKDKSSVFANLDELCHDELLTQQERDFIRDTLKSLQ